MVRMTLCPQCGSIQRAGTTCPLCKRPIPWEKEYDAWEKKQANETATVIRAAHR